MPNLSGEKRTLEIRTALSPDALLLTRLQGREAISELFSFRLSLLAPEPIAFADVLGLPATVFLRVPGSPERVFNGILTDLEEGQSFRRPFGAGFYIRYEAVFEPRMSLLKHQVQSRIWQSITVPDLLGAILKDQWQLKVQMRLSANYAARDYCVQYRESDLAFVSRLMEEEGIRYYFEHRDGEHSLVLVDHPTQHTALPGQSTLRFDSVVGGYRETGVVREWKKRQRVCGHKRTERDYSFFKPFVWPGATHRINPSVKVGDVKHDLTVPGGLPTDLMTTKNFPAGTARHVDRTAPGGADQPDRIEPMFSDVERIAAIRMEEVTTTAIEITGTSDYGHLQPGYRITLTEAGHANGDYALTSVEHRADIEPSFLQQQATEPIYENTLGAIPVELPYRPARRTPRPRIDGVQTAFVVGPKGEDMFLDRYGRVKVRFIWDFREGYGTESSCWVRVSQVWAGRRWGAFFWPRVGHEVIVAFEEGDPERPIITGSVYNDRNMPPFELPEHRVKGGIKSFSSSGDLNAECDPLANFNGLVFHDKQGEEHVELHSERDTFNHSEHSHFHNVATTHRLNVGKRRSTHVGAIPRGSGSGAGEADGPSFFYNPETDTAKMIGADLTSVCGINQTNTLGVYGAFTVGDPLTVVVNPVGLIADGCSMISANPLAQSVLGTIGSVFGGTNTMVLANQSTVAYGRQLSVTRAGRAALSSSTNYDDHGFSSPTRILTLLANTLGAISAVLLTTGLITADWDAYSTDDDAWLIELGVGGGLLFVASEIELVISLYQQAEGAKQVATAATASLSAQTVAIDAANLTSLVANDRKSLNKLEYVGGCKGHFTQATISGAEKTQMLYAGTKADEQTMLVLEPNMLTMLAGNSLTGRPFGWIQEEFS